MILQILQRAPKVDTSWFNYGVCLDELGRYGEAAEAFIKAQEFNIKDWGIHYRILRSFRLANDLDQFWEYADYSCGLNSDLLQAIRSCDEFRELVVTTEFRHLEEKYERNRTA